MSYDGKVHCPDYTYEVFSPIRFKYLVERCLEKVKAIRERHPEIEALACCGNSGIPLVGALAYALDLGMLVVRKKPNEKGHDSSMVNGTVEVKAYLFVDDLICNGTTLRHTRREIERLNPKAVCVGALLYHEDYNINYPRWLGDTDACGFIWGARAKGIDITWDKANDQELHEKLNGPKKGLAPVLPMPMRPNYSPAEVAEFERAARALADNIDFQVVKSPRLVLPPDPLPTFGPPPTAAEREAAGKLLQAFRETASMYPNLKVMLKKAKPEPVRERALSMEDVATAWSQVQAADKIFSLTKPPEPVVIDRITRQVITNKKLADIVAATDPKAVIPVEGPAQLITADDKPDALAFTLVQPREEQAEEIKYEAGRWSWDG